MPLVHDVPPLRGVFLRSLVALGMCVFCTPPVSACQDISDPPLVQAVAPETHGAVFLTHALQTFPDLVSAQGLTEERVPDLDTWWESWMLDGSEGGQLRAELYPAVSARLLPLITNSGLEDLLTRNGEALANARSADLLLLSDALHSALDRAWSLHSEALGALADGLGERALVLAFQSADAIREISPEHVASALVQEATEGLGRIGTAHAYSDQVLTRIRRLTLGAREALAEGDYPRAIRRAYYACQLLGADPG